jgi:hypothetical protein
VTIVVGAAAVDVYRVHETTAVKIYIPYNVKIEDYVPYDVLAVDVEVYIPDNVKAVAVESYIPHNVKAVTV